MFQTRMQNIQIKMIQGSKLLQILIIVLFSITSVIAWNATTIWTVPVNDTNNDTLTSPSMDENNQVSFNDNINDTTSTSTAIFKYQDNKVIESIENLEGLNTTVNVDVLDEDINCTLTRKRQVPVNESYQNNVDGTYTLDGPGLADVCKIPFFFPLCCLQAAILRQRQLETNSNDLQQNSTMEDHYPPCMDGMCCNDTKVIIQQPDPTDGDPIKTRVIKDIKFIDQLTPNDEIVDESTTGNLNLIDIISEMSEDVDNKKRAIVGPILQCEHIHENENHQLTSGQDPIINVHLSNENEYREEKKHHKREYHYNQPEMEIVNVRTAGRRLEVKDFQTADIFTDEVQDDVYSDEMDKEMNRNYRMNYKIGRHSKTRQTEKIDEEESDSPEKKDDQQSDSSVTKNDEGSESTTEKTEDDEETTTTTEEKEDVTEEETSPSTTSTTTTPPTTTTTTTTTMTTTTTTTKKNEEDIANYNVDEEVDSEEEEKKKGISLDQYRAQNMSRKSTSKKPEVKSEEEEDETEEETTIASTTIKTTTTELTTTKKSPTKTTTPKKSPTKPPMTTTIGSKDDHAKPKRQRLKQKSGGHDDDDDKMDDSDEEYEEEICPRGRAGPKCSVDVTDAIRYPGYFLHVGQQPTNFNRARAMCLNRNMTLAFLSTALEEDLFARAMIYHEKMASPSQITGQSPPASYWTGMTRDYGRNKFKWEDGSEVKNFGNLISEIDDRRTTPATFCVAIFAITSNSDRFSGLDDDDDDDDDDDSDNNERVKDHLKLDCSYNPQASYPVCMYRLGSKLPPKLRRISYRD